MRVAEKIGMVKEKELLRGSQLYYVYSQSRQSSENRA
jgi:hypothetical protein